MKISYMILTLIFISCQSIDKANHAEYCYQETELLKGNSSFDVHFDFNLLTEEQIENLQKQVTISLCRGAIPLNGIFRIDDDSIETLLTTDWYCVDSTNFHDEIPPPLYLFPSQQVLINSRGQILINAELVNLDSVPNFISKLSRDYFWNNSHKLVAYEIKWDKKTNNTLKLNVFKGVVKGYLQAANEISLEEFNTKLCELDNVNLEELKQNFRFTFLIKKELPVPPPPPDGLYDVNSNTIKRD